MTGHGTTPTAGRGERTGRARPHQPIRRCRNGCQIGLGLGVPSDWIMPHAFSSHRKPRPTLHVSGARHSSAPQLLCRPPSRCFLLFPSPLQIANMTVWTPSPFRDTSVCHGQLSCVARHDFRHDWQLGAPGLHSASSVSAFASFTSPSAATLGARNGQQFPPQNFTLPRASYRLLHSLTVSRNRTENIRGQLPPISRQTGPSAPFPAVSRTKPVSRNCPRGDFQTGGSTRSQHRPCGRGAPSREIGGHFSRFHHHPTVPRSRACRGGTKYSRGLGQHGFGEAHAILRTCTLRLSSCVCRALGSNLPSACVDERTPPLHGKEHVR